jgi:type II secretory pathway component PulC
VMNRIVGMLERVAPGVSNRLPLPAGVAAPAKPPVQVAAAVKPAAKPAPQPASNEPKRRLSGVVEFGGGKSVVTIEYNGATQRVYIGEPVGSTGWTLIDVKGTTATFRKNGEIRTLSDQEFF